MAIARSGWLGVMGSLIAGYLASKISVAIGGFNTAFTGETFIGSLLLTVYYMPLFALGITIAMRLDRLKRLVARMHTYIHLIFIIIIMLIPHALLKNHFILADIWYGISASYAIVCCLTFSRLEAILSIRLFKWLGRISYSLYLVHFPILMASLYFFNGSLPFPIILILSFLFILLVANLMNIFIEQPSMQIGKRLAYGK
jgi:peptidoglycan/LPS O-acetylase OafA/YrhL